MFRESIFVGLISTYVSCVDAFVVFIPFPQYKLCHMSMGFRKFFCCCLGSRGCFSLSSRFLMVFGGKGYCDVVSLSSVV